MAKLFFKLHGVPDDEAEDVRALLTAHEIEFYETHAGNWGVSLAAIWLRHDEQFPKARALLDQYQAERVGAMRAAYQQETDKKHSYWLRELLASPLRLLVYLLVIAAVVYLSTVPFFKLGS